MGTSTASVKRWREENREVYLERQREYNRRWRAENKEKNAERQANYRQTLKGRCIIAISDSKYRANLHNFEPCNATTEELIESFDGRCHICKAEESSPKLSMDHNHETGDFRGWLCNRCNLVLGMVEDDPQLLRLMDDYLKGGEQ